jgi:hypothetical protein
MLPRDLIDVPPRSLSRLQRLSTRDADRFIRCAPECSGDGGPTLTTHGKAPPLPGCPNGRRRGICVIGHEWAVLRHPRPWNLRVPGPQLGHGQSLSWNRRADSMSHTRRLHAPPPLYRFLCCADMSRNCAASTQQSHHPLQILTQGEPRLSWPSNLQFPVGSDGAWPVRPKAAPGGRALS